MASEESNTKAGGQSARTGQENSQRWAKLVAQAWADDKFKQRLLNNPAAVLKEFGAPVPAGVEVRVVENTNSVVHLTLPAKPVGDVTELTESQLSGVFGGFSCSHYCYRDPDCIIIGPVTILTPPSR